jgi:hypothetical protein
MSAQLASDQFFIVKTKRYSAKIALLAAAGALVAGSLDAGIVYAPTNFTVDVTQSDLNFRITGTNIEAADDDLACSEAGWNNNYTAYFTYCGNGGSNSHIGAGTMVPNFIFGQSTLPVGTTISATDYTTWATYVSNLLISSGTYYVPFYLTNQGANSDKTYYGYFELTYVKDTSLTLIGGAIENTGAAIVTSDIASAVPEPSETAGALGALAGAAALGAAWKRRKSRS